MSEPTSTELARLHELCQGHGKGGASIYTAAIERIEELETALRALRDLPPVGVIPDNGDYRRGYNVARDRVSVIAKKALGD